MTEEVVLGMSGGVDSSVAAYLLQEQGYKVIGMTMRLVNEKYMKDKSCNSRNVEEAKSVADQLGIQHIDVDFKQDFDRKIIDYFVREYSLGYTPNPCIACNKFIKFDKFYEKARELGADYISTGHYVNSEYDEDSGVYLLKTAKDPVKDQTYFLYNITQEVLKHCRFPLGNLTKPEVRRIAKDMNMRTYAKDDSEEICFIENDDHGDFIERRNPDLIKPGNFVDEEGNILGKHKGIIYYTVGQRKGLGIALGKRVYVSKINGKTGDITLSDEDKLYKDQVELKDINLISREVLEKPEVFECKIRHGTKTYPAEIRQDNDRLIAEFIEPVRAPSKGQSLVMYDGDIVVGGGVIDKIEGE